MEESEKRILDKSVRSLFEERPAFMKDSEVQLESCTVKDSTALLIIQANKVSVEEQNIINLSLQKELTKLDGVEAVKVIFTSSKQDTSSKPKEAPDIQIGGHPKGGQTSLRPKSVKKIIAVASGKGGVGKSTFVSNLASELIKRGFTVGIIDADMHGPSQPNLLGSWEKPKTSPETKMILPSIAKGIKFISIGLLVPENQALIWRGPMLMGALEQFLRDVEWGKLDFLLVDLPPGTGDVQLTLSQKAHIDGSIIISTPQDIALIDARKAIQMFDRLNVKIFGLVENMSTYICGKCGHQDYIFGDSGVKEEAKALNLPFLGDIPLDRKIREDSDKGTPSVLANPDSKPSQSFSKILDSLLNIVKI